MTDYKITVNSLLFAHIIFKIIRLSVFGLLSRVEGLKEATSTQA